MDIVYKTYQNNPPHLFQPNAHYFITGATLYHIRHFDTAALKEKTLEYMFKSFTHYGWSIEDWVLLDNHYHLMARAPEQAFSLAHVINNFHKFSAMWVKKTKQVRDDQKIWHNYWDTCITYESSYFARLHYIWFNPVKHGYVNDSYNWKFGSFVSRDPAETKTIMTNYPIDRLAIKDDY